MSGPAPDFRRHPLDARIPPPLVLAAFALAMWAVARLWPGAGSHIAWATPAAIVAAVGALALELAASWRFLRAKTTVDPRHPERSARLVTGGLHRVSRNPMYVGQALLLFAWALRLTHPAAFALAALFPLYITRFQILPEERALAARFGAEYAAYRDRVRRWL